MATLLVQNVVTHQVRLSDIGQWGGIIIQPNEIYDLFVKLSYDEQEDLAVSGAVGGDLYNALQAGELVLMKTANPTDGYYPQGSIPDLEVYLQSAASGNVTGPVGTPNRNFSIFNGTTGKSIADSGINVDDLFEGFKEPTGFKNRTDSKVSFDSGTRTFTIQPTSISFDYYIHGKKFTITTVKNFIIPDVQGMHFLYLDETENIQVQSGGFIPALLTTYAYISAIYWDVGSQTATYIGDERHGTVMDGATHLHLHLSLGTQYISGLALNSIVADGTGNLATEVQFGVDNGIIRDEDLEHIIEHSPTGADNTTVALEQILANPAEIPVLYRSGINGDWKTKSADNYPIIYHGTAGYTDAVNQLPAWNEWTGTAWQLTPVANNKFVLVHYLATNDLRYPIIGLQGIAEYQNKPAGREAARQELASLSGLPFQEFTPIATVIWECRSVYTNVPKARIRTTGDAKDYVDWRQIEPYSSTTGGGLTDHGNLGGLLDDDHPQYHNDARGDARYYTQTQLNGGQLDNRYYTETEIDVHTGDSTIHFPKSSIALDDLGDVTITTPTNGQMLVYQTGGWVNQLVPTGDELVKISGNDTTAGYLNGKLIAGTNVTLTENNDGGNETLTIDAVLPATATHFFGHNGGITQTFSAATTINFSTVIRSDADYTEAVVVGGTEVTINTTGWYEITYSMSATNTSGTRRSSHTYVEVNTGGGFVITPGSSSYAYHRNTTAGSDTASGNLVIYLTSGDVVRVRSTAGGLIVTHANGCRLNIKSISGI